MGIHDCIIFLINFEYDSIELSPPFHNMTLHFFSKCQHLDIESRDGYIPVENQNDLELDFKVFFFVDSHC